MNLLKSINKWIWPSGFSPVIKTSEERVTLTIVYNQVNFKQEIPA